MVVERRWVNVLEGREVERTARPQIFHSVMCLPNQSSFSLYVNQHSCTLPGWLLVVRNHRTAFSGSAQPGQNGVCQERNCTKKIQDVLRLCSRQHFWLGFISFLVPANAGNLPLPYFSPLLQFGNKTT